MKVKPLQSVMLSVSELKANEGQVPGLPANPRTITKKKMKKLIASLKKDPDMMSLREILVFKHNDEYVVIGGNQRVQALKEIDISEVPCKVIPEGTTAEQLRAYLVKDNLEFGSWVDDMLASDWDLKELVKMGLEEAADLEVDDEPSVPPVAETPSSEIKEEEQIPQHVHVDVPENPVLEQPTPVIEEKEEPVREEVVVPSCDQSQDREEKTAEEEHHNEEGMTAEEETTPTVDLPPTTPEEEPTPTPVNIPSEYPSDGQPINEPTADEQPVEQKTDKPEQAYEAQAKVTILTIGALSIPLSTAERDTIIRRANVYNQEHGNCIGLLAELL